MTLRVAFLNPNATSAMTEEMVAVARAEAGEMAEIVGLTNRAGPPAIQSAEDAAASLPGLFEMCRTALQNGADAMVIGCFDDTGLEEIRQSAERPIIGLGEAGCLAASLQRPSFAVVTTTSGSVPVIEANIARMGLGPRCFGVIPAEVPVLELAARIEHVRAVIASTAAAAPEAAIVLGCAGMSPLAGRLSAGIGVPVIDPTRAAIGLARAAAGAASASDARLGTPPAARGTGGAVASR